MAPSFEHEVVELRGGVLVTSERAEGSPMAVAPEPDRVEDTGDLDDVVAFIAAQQARPDRRITTLGEDVGGITAELAALTPPWPGTVRVLRDGPTIRGALVAEWDLELGRAWLHGPWVADAAGPSDRAGDDGWLTAAATLLDAGLAQLPPGIARSELAGDGANRRLAALAAARGLVASETSHILVADRAVTTAWPPEIDPAGTLRPAGEGDVAAIAALHDAAFPGTYATAATLVAGQLDGSRLVLVADGGAPGGVAGYASGEVHPDGEGYLDFVAVADAARGTGVGRRLVTAITRRLLERSPEGRVALTVDEGRQAARALYGSLGFHAEGTIVTYRADR